eukprot:scaffold303_cov285-Chaetoceros_neogracile.AAC.26
MEPSLALSRLFAYPQEELDSRAATLLYELFWTSIVHSKIQASSTETVQKYGRQGSKWKLWRYSECLKKGCFVDTTVGDGKTSGHNSEQ